MDFKIKRSFPFHGYRRLEAAAKKEMNVAGGGIHGKRGEGKEMGHSQEGEGKRGYLRVGGQLSGRPYSTAPTKGVI